jgi:hypothetical protein
MNLVLLDNACYRQEWVCVNITLNVTSDLSDEQTKRNILCKISFVIWMINFLIYSAFEFDGKNEWKI